MLIAGEIVLQMIEQVVPLTKAIACHSRSLADQADRAADSAAMNYTEGMRRENRDRANRLRIAIGSADELRMALRIALVRGYIGEADEALQLIDRGIRLLYGLMRPNRPPTGTTSRARDRQGPPSR